jgi:hypothetical protein
VQKFFGDKETSKADFKVKSLQTALQKL